MLPEQFLERMQEMLGEEFAPFLDSFSREKYQALRLNELKIAMSGESAAVLLVPGEDGKFFHHDKRYYIVMLRKAFPNKEFRFHYLRQYAMDMRQHS